MKNLRFKCNEDLNVMKNFQTNSEVLNLLPVRSTNKNGYEKKPETSYKMYLSLI